MPAGSYGGGEEPTCGTPTLTPTLPRVNAPFIFWQLVVPLISVLMAFLCIPYFTCKVLLQQLTHLTPEQVVASLCPDIQYPLWLRLFGIHEPVPMFF